MAGETIITVVGNLTRDPELRTVGNGSTVVNFTIASSTRTFNRNTNQWDDGDTLFLNCSAWDSARTSMATNIANSLSKGMRVIAQGALPSVRTRHRMVPSAALWNCVSTRLAPRCPVRPPR